MPGRVVFDCDVERLDGQIVFYYRARHDLTVGYKWSSTVSCMGKHLGLIDNYLDYEL